VQRDSKYYEPDEYTPERNPWHPARAKVRLNNNVYLISSPDNNLGELTVRQIEGKSDGSFAPRLEFYCNAYHPELRGQNIPHAALRLGQMIARDFHGVVVWYSSQDRSRPPKESDKVERP